MGHEKRGYTKTGGYKISSNQSILYCSQENIIHNQQSGCRTIPLDDSPGQFPPGQFPLPFWVRHFPLGQFPPIYYAYIHMHVCTHTHIHTYIHTYIYTHTYTHTYIHIHIYTCIHIQAYIYIIHTHKYRHTYTSVCMYASILCMYVCIRIMYKYAKICRYI